MAGLGVQWGTYGDIDPQLPELDLSYLLGLDCSDKQNMVLFLGESIRGSEFVFGDPQVELSCWFPWYDSGLQVLRKCGNGENPPPPRSLFGSEGVFSNIPHTEARLRVAITPADHRLQSENVFPLSGC